MTQPLHVSTQAELDAFLDAHPTMKFFDVMVQPLFGPLRGKRVLRHEMAGIWKSGRFLPGSILVVDNTGADCEATGLVWETGDVDRVVRPTAGTLAPAPWLGDDVGQFIGSLHTLDNVPDELDPRVILQGVLDRFTADRLTPDVACELEFYLCDQRANGTAPKPARSPVTGFVPFAAETNGFRELDDQMPYLRDLYAAAEAQGLPIEAMIAEISPGQLEIGLDHRPDALRVADDAVMFKRLVKGVAVAHGMEATFMAKPFMGLPGSGMHIHVSVLDDKGTNIFGADDPQGTPALRHAVWGMAHLMPQSMGIFAPNANSWRRFVGQAYAPTAATWGVNNRTVSLRVTAGPASSRHIEHRICGADAPPHLALAAVLAGVHHGLTHKGDPGPAIEGDAYSQTDKAITRLPRSWDAAIEALADDGILASYLGSRAVRMMRIIKETERDRHMAEIPVQDFDWGFRNA
ncbi:MAG: glutamine synthetase family protein [Hyphomonadaceae bacterium]|jgi:glutamine synthetase|nr:glutamine synthetase family protein [Hyphomonadaceae bacterium]